MSKRQETILVVDADAAYRESMRRALREHGYRVLDASDYQNACNVNQQHFGEIDLLLTAISLPGGNGYGLASKLTGMDPSVKVLFVSGETGAMISRYFKMPEMDRHTLHRPFESAELLLRVRSILSRAAGTC